MTGASATPLSADDIADALGRPRPTEQQRLVIEAEPGPALVVAGAGSGKTETMANRVLWLLATGRVRPGEVLGLTFTRKAAGELAARIRERIAQLVAAGLAPAAADEFDVPQVGTYNAFAAAIFRDNALTIGREGDGALLGEAAAWQLARRVVTDSADPGIAELGRDSVEPVVRAVLELSRALAENDADPAEARALASGFAALAELPAGGRGGYAEVLERIRSVAALDVLLDLAAEFERRKRARGLVEFSDQVALALRVLRRSPDVAAGLRARHRVVLLDEYQDTSVVQAGLLAELFRDGTVMAVGDPNQSIYGWRGASAANLEQFASRFCSGRAQRFSLSTSWRNSHGILEVANRIAAPLAEAARVPVLPLEPGPTASHAPVDVVVAETIEDEAAATARWFRDILATGSGSTAGPPSAALLFRARAAQGPFLAALAREGVPYHVLGVAGLLAEPEIADLVAALRVVHDPGAGSELVRLLAGSRWSIGVRDLAGLRSLARWLAARDHAQRRLDDGVRARFRDSVAAGEDASIVEALDFLVDAPASHRELQRFSAEGLARMREAGTLFRGLRARVGLDLVDLVALVEQELLLDVEVAANERRSAGGAHREALADALAGFLAVDDAGGLGGFLSWLAEAQRRDDLAARQEDAEPGCVQVLTIHSAKGLEWDAVAVPRLVRDELPARPRDARGWLSLGRLPYELRGDADDLPRLAWRQATTRRQLREAIDAFVAEVAERHAREERRLGYVAVTRARHRLLMTASFWGRQARPRPPGAFLVELAEAGIIPPLPTASAYDENPLGDAEQTFRWPIDPLGERRPRVVAAAAAVRAA
ncbi:MAG: ATP-dependent helicase, partial [Microbacteriaceae bacterium]